MIVDTFEEYRYACNLKRICMNIVINRWLKVELRTLTSICPNLDHGNVCPAFHLNNVGALVCMTTQNVLGFTKFLKLWSLHGCLATSKKAVGKSFRDPLHESFFFGDQCGVDEYVAAHEAHGKAIPKVMLSDDVLDEHYRIVKYHILSGPTCSQALLQLVPRVFFPFFFFFFLGGGVWV